MVLFFVSKTFVIFSICTQAYKCKLQLRVINKGETVKAEYSFFLISINY